jgi:hypothetical protein
MKYVTFIGYNFVVRTELYIDMNNSCVLENVVDADLTVHTGCGVAFLRNLT